MSVRRANADDIPQLAELVSSLAGFYLDDPNTELPAWFKETISEPAFEARIKSQDYVNILYENAGRVEGYAALKDGSHLYHLFVAKSQQRTGIATLLWRSLLTYCHADLVTVRSSMYAVPVYERFGFTVERPAGLKDGIAFQPLVLKLNHRG
ncbi:GNAT family N-acetyltransferase [Halioxenophilus aromaticivorans]